MTPTPLFNLLPATWAEASAPGTLWQLAVLALCMVVGWMLARVMRSSLAAREPRMRVMRLSVESFSRVLAPLLILLLVAVAKLIMARWNPVNLLQLAIPLMASFAFIRLMFYILRRVFAHGGKAGGFLLLFEKSFATLVWVGVALYLTGLWPGMVAYLDEIVIPIGRHKASLLMIFQAVASVGVTLILALWGAAVLEERLMRLDTMHSSLRAVVARMGRATLILIAVLVSLSLVGIDLTILSVFGGALGVGLGLGLQKLVSSYVSGFVILLERSLTIGDVITVDKYSGSVTQINTRYTVLRGSDGVESVVPNEMLVSSPIQNYSLSDRSMRLATQIAINYDADVERVLQVLEQSVAGIGRLSFNPPPKASLIKFAAEGFEFELGFWITDPENGRLNVVSDVNKAIWHGLRKNNIDIAHLKPKPAQLQQVDGSNVEQSALPPDVVPKSFEDKESKIQGPKPGK